MGISVYGWAGADSRCPEPACTGAVPHESPLSPFATASSPPPDDPTPSPRCRHGCQELCCHSLWPRSAGRSSSAVCASAVRHLSCPPAPSITALPWPCRPIKAAMMPSTLAQAPFAPMGIARVHRAGVELSRSCSHSAACRSLYVFLSPLYSP